MDIQLEQTEILALGSMVNSNGWKVYKKLIEDIYDKEYRRLKEVNKDDLQLVQGSLKGIDKINKLINSVYFEDAGTKAKIIGQ